MTAAVGFPTLRLIRYQIGDWTLDGIASGGWVETEVPEAMKRLLAQQTRKPARRTGIKPETGKKKSWKR